MRSRPSRGLPLLSDYVNLSRLEGTVFPLPTADKEYDGPSFPHQLAQSVVQEGHGRASGFEHVHISTGQAARTDYYASCSLLY